MNADAPRTSRLRRFWQRRWVRWSLLLFALLVLGWVLRFRILYHAGQFLITEDPLVPTDEVYVLGGASVDRGLEAARVFHQGVRGPFVCTGESVPQDLEAMGIGMSESDLTRRVAVEHGVPGDQVISFRAGTSTKEEADALLQRAIAEQVDTVMVISSSFHLRRIGFVFKERFQEKGITVLLHGAPSERFSNDAWWGTEDGLLMVSNEYIKLVYYHLKY